MVEKRHFIKDDGFENISVLKIYASCCCISRPTFKTKSGCRGNGDTYLGFYRRLALASVVLGGVTACCFGGFLPLSIMLNSN